MSWGPDAVRPADDDPTGGLIGSDEELGLGDIDVEDSELDLLMERLRTIGAAVDPVPSIVAELASAALETRDLDAELASLTADSATDSTALVRGTAVATPRMMSFEAGSVTVELQVDRRDDSVATAVLRGFVLGAERVAIEFRTGVRPVPIDDSGWFLIDDVPAGAVRLRIERSGGGLVTTEWMTV